LGNDKLILTLWIKIEYKKIKIRLNLPKVEKEERELRGKRGKELKWINFKATIILVEIIKTLTPSLFHEIKFNMIKITTEMILI
jgi:hypothetical protein